MVILMISVAKTKIYVTISKVYMRNARSSQMLYSSLKILCSSDAYTILVHSLGSSNLRSFAYVLSNQI